MQDHPWTRQRVVVWLEPRKRRTEDGIPLLSATDLRELVSAGDLC